MKENMDEWDYNKINNLFRGIVNNTNNYLKELKSRIKNGEQSQDVFDQYLAKHDIYQSLSGKLCLTSKETLISELRDMLRNPRHNSSRVFDNKNYIRWWKSFIAEMIIDLEKGKYPII
ncbi:MAG: hypothetical protein WA126_15045 [Thermodesulfovibrionales bacterium]